jgi:hypothetical protein
MYTMSHLSYIDYKRLQLVTVLRHVHKVMSWVSRRQQSDPFVSTSPFLKFLIQRQSEWVYL